MSNDSKDSPLLWIVACVPLLGLLVAAIVSAAGGIASTAIDSALISAGIAGFLLALIATTMDPKETRSWAWLWGIVLVAVVIPLIYISDRRRKGTASANIEKWAIGTLVIAAVGVLVCATSVAPKVIKGTDLVAQISGTKSTTGLKVEAAICQDLKERAGSVALCNAYIDTEQVTLKVTYVGSGDFTWQADGLGWGI